MGFNWWLNSIIMRIGTIAQHANIGPHGPASILPNGAIPGRLNDFKFIGWWDFTDNNFSVAPGTNTVNLQLVKDKGPHGADLKSDSTIKGPSYKPESLGQDKHKYAEISYFIGEKKFQNLGLGSLAIKKVCKIAKSKYKLKKLIAGVYENNVPSKKVLEKNKFKLEGCILKKYLFEGKRISELIYGKLL